MAVAVRITLMRIAKHATYKPPTDCQPVINEVPSFITTSTALSSFYTGISTADSGTADAPTEEVVAMHTAIQPSRALCAAYALESLITGLPLLLIDWLVTGAGLIMAAYFVNLSQGHALNPGVWLQLPALLLLQTLLMSVHQLYPGSGTSPVIELRGIVRSTVLALFCLSAMNIVLGQLPRIEFVTFIATAICVATLLPLARWTARHVLAKTSWWGVRILLIGQRDDCLATLRQLLRRRSSGFIPAGYTCDADDANEYGSVDKYLLGINSEATAVARRHLAPVAGLVSSDSDLHSTDRLIFQFPSVVWIDFAHAARKELDTSNLPHVFTTRTNMPFLRFMPRICKRAVDLAICIPGLVVLALPMAAIALAIKYFSSGPVIYGSPRVGQHGKQFKMWKFRSMVPEADKVLQQRLDSDPAARMEWEQNSKLKSDPRIVPGIGHFIRRWSLDELPQLWNVMVGEMSLVGPRPVPPDEIIRYQEHYYEYTQMWPGVTGLWQVSGRNDTTFETRVFLVHHYARNWSPWMDIWVLLNTPAVVLSRDGAY